jgi:dolichyldiphosphatase
MPSSHAQFTTFFAITLALFLLARHTPSPTSTAWSASYSNRMLLSTVAIVGAGMVSTARVYLRYHTPKQVLAGASAGITIALIWFSLTSLARNQGWIDSFLDWEIVRWTRLRDLITTEDVADAGWDRWEIRRSKRKTQRGLTSSKASSRKKVRIDPKTA